LAALTLIARCKASAFGTGDMHESPSIHKGFTACYARRPGGEVRRGKVVPTGDQVRTLLDGVDVPRRNTGTAARPCEEQRSPSTPTGKRYSFPLRCRTPSWSLDVRCCATR
jgi:hypothetical protein